MSVNNVIHKIRFTPRVYTLPVSAIGKYIKTVQNNNNLVTLSGKKIKTNG